MTLGLTGAGTPVAAEPVLPGLGEVDGWVDATGDQMFGNLDMDVNSVLFRSLALNADSAGNLQWDGNDVCVVGSALAGCTAPGDITAVTAGTGLTGGGASGAVTLAVDTSVIQQRVTGTCPAGQAIAAIGATGTVTCIVDRTPIAAAGGNNAGTAFLAGGACTNLPGASVTLTVPSSGTILLTGNAEVQFHHLAAAQEFAAFFIGTTAADCNLMTIGFRSIMDLPASATVPSTARETVHVQSAVSVTAGTYSYFLNGAQSAGQDSANDRFIGGSLTGVFYPA